MDTFISFGYVFSSIRELWDALKNDIKLVTVAFSHRRSKDRAREKFLFTNRLISLKNRLALGFQSDVQEILCCEASLKALYDKELEGSKIRSRVKWMEEGELPSRYFFSMEKQRHEGTLLSSVFNSEGIEVSSLADMIAHENYYDNLFSNEEVDLAVPNELLSHVSALLSALLTSLFKPTCAFVFLYQFSSPGEKNFRILLFFLKVSFIWGVEVPQ